MQNHKREDSLRKLLTVRACIVTCIILHLSILVHASFSRFPVVDELGHLPAGISYWELGRFDYYRVNPPLADLIGGLPAWLGRSDYDVRRYDARVGRRPEFEVGFAKLQQKKLSLQSSFVASRLACCLFSLAGILLLSYWVYRLLGIYSSFIVTVLWCFCPNILAYGPALVPDVCALSVFVIASFGFWNYIRNPCIRSCILAGFGLGFLLATKLTWITGILSFPSVVLLHEVFSKRMGFNWVMHRSRDMLFSILIALATLNSLYLFEGSFTDINRYDFCSELFGGVGSNSVVLGNRFRGSWMGNIIVPLPKNYVLGIDYLRHEVEQRQWSFLLGEWKLGSWPHYYLMTTLIKTPEPTLILSFVGFFLFVFCLKKRLCDGDTIGLFMILSIPSLLCFLSVSFQGGFNHHHRYVLMIYPPMFALAAYIASPVGIKLLRFRLPFFGAEKRSIAVPLGITLVILSAASSLRVHPYYTSYYNTLCGGPENGWHLLGFSNIDWGQDILEIDKWLNENPDKRPLVMDIDYFGMNGDLFEVSTSSPPQLPKGTSIDEVRRSATETQWWIISVKKLYNLPGHDGLEYLQQIEPVDKIAYCYHVYRIDPLPATPLSN
jgi:hypothetical protein